MNDLIVYMVFEILENFYEDNDKTHWETFFTEEEAMEFAAKTKKWYGAEFKVEPYTIKANRGG